jgi:hypothetical protein
VLHPVAALQYLLVAVAASAPVPKGAGPADYFPTKVGTRWVYEVSGDEPAEVAEEVVSVEEKDGTRVVMLRVEHKSVDPATKTPVTAIWKDKVLVRKDGVFAVTWWSAEPGLCLLRLPHARGNTWEERHPYLDTGDTLKRTCSASDPEEVKVPAGAYKAVRVETTHSVAGKAGAQTARFSDDWYAPGVGLVKQERRDVNRVRVLKEFTPGKG